MMPRTHDLKVWPTHWELIASGRKTFEIRKNDRDYRAGDELRLRCWDPDTQDYRSQQYIRVAVTFVFSPSEAEARALGWSGWPQDLIAMAIQPLDTYGVDMASGRDQSVRRTAP